MGGGTGTGDATTKTELLLDKMELLKLRYSRYMQEQQGTPVLSGRILRKKMDSNATNSSLGKNKK